MGNPIPVQFSSNAPQNSPRYRGNCDPSHLWRNNPVDPKSGHVGDQDLEKQQAKAAGGKDGAKHRPSLAPLVGMFVLDEALLVATSLSLWLTGVSPIPLVPMIVNRAGEIVVVICMQHPIHAVLSGLQMVLAFVAGVLFIAADGSLCSGMQRGQCSIAMVCAIIFFCEAVVFATTVTVHYQLRSSWSQSFWRIKRGTSVKCKHKSSNDNTNGSKLSSISSPDKGHLAMQPWAVSHSAAAAMDWLREGAVVTDWWQMPQDQARDTSNITVRGMGGEAIVLEDAPSFQHIPGRGDGKRDPVVITGMQKLQISQIDDDGDAFKCTPDNSPTQTPTGNLAGASSAETDPYGPSPLQSFRSQADVEISTPSSTKG